MNELLYRQDSKAAFERLTEWWQGGDLGRPAMQILVPRPEPIEPVDIIPTPPGWSTNYSTSSFAYRVNLAARACIYTDYWGEAIPNVSPDLGPNCLALYLGCRAKDGEDTVWFEPCIESPEKARYELLPDNFYWNFTIRLAKEQLHFGKGKFLTSFPDLIEGLDTLAAMRGTQLFLYDLIERPDWVQDSLKRVTQSYFDCYDFLYDLIKDDTGGSHFWAWAPGRIAKLQCDISAMISPRMFGEFMIPVLREMTGRLDYCIYHWDGPGAIPHHDNLLSIPGIDAIQWTSGAGAEPVWDDRWWPFYHKTLDAGKKIMLLDFDAGHLDNFKKEFGRKFRNFIFGIAAGTPQEAQKILKIAEN
jgi:5-methyltetrahydrofolate--homocysteine methyltransferase